MGEMSDGLQKLLGAIALAIILGLVQLINGWKSGKGTSKPIEGTVVSATLADGQAVRDLIDAIRRLTVEVCDSREQRHRDSLAERDTADVLNGTLNEIQQLMRHGGGMAPDWSSLLEKLGAHKSTGDRA